MLVFALIVAEVAEVAGFSGVPYRGFSEKTPGGGVFFSASLKLLRTILNPLIPRISKKRPYTTV